MRFLKNKINLAKFAADHDFLSTQDASIQVKCEEPSISPNKSLQSQEINSLPSQFHELPLSTRKPRKNPTSPHASSKNIIKNYGKALCSFAASDLALPYIERIIEKRNFQFIKAKKFMEYINERKSQVNNIESIRALLIQKEKEDLNTKAYKQIFQDISVVFLKYFSVNWIYSGKIIQKKAHLNFRFKMLRRIQNPQHFTYLKTTFSRH